MKKSRRNHGPAFKAQVPLAACKGDKTLAELGEQFGVHPTQVTEWKRHLLERAADVFGGTTHKPDTRDRRTPSGPSVCWRPHVARSAQARRPSMVQSEAKDTTNHGHARPVMMRSGKGLKTADNNPIPSAFGAIWTRRKR